MLRFSLFTEPEHGNQLIIKSKSFPRFFLESFCFMAIYPTFAVLLNLGSEKANLRGY